MNSTRERNSQKKKKKKKSAGKLGTIIFQTAFFDWIILNADEIGIVDWVAAPDCNIAL